MPAAVRLKRCCSSARTQDVALDLVEVLRQVARQRLLGRQRIGAGAGASVGIDRRASVAAIRSSSCAALSVNTDSGRPRS